MFCSCNLGQLYEPQWFLMLTYSICHHSDGLYFISGTAFTEGILWGVQIPLLFLAYVNLSLIFKSKSKIVLIQCLGSFSCSTTVSYPFRNKSFVLNVALLYPLVIIMLLSSSRWCVCYSIGTKQQCWHHGAFMCREVLNLVKLATSCRITAGTLSSLDGMVLHLISDNKLTYILLCTLFKV